MGEDSDLHQESNVNDGDLEDSENDSDDDVIHRGFSNKSRKRLKKGNTDFLDEDDLVLIDEARGIIRDDVDTDHRFHRDFTEGKRKTIKMDKRQMATSIKAR